MQENRATQSQRLKALARYVGNIHKRRPGRYRAETQNKMHQKARARRMDPYDGRLETR